MTLNLELSHVIAIVAALLGYLTASLIAWGRLSADVKTMKDAQEKMASLADLKAAVAQMETTIYKALRGRRKTDHEEIE